MSVHMGTTKQENTNTKKFVPRWSQALSSKNSTLILSLEEGAGMGTWLFSKEYLADTGKIHPNGKLENPSIYKSFIEFPWLV